MKYKYNMQEFVNQHLDESLKEIYDTELYKYRKNKQLLKSKKQRIKDEFEEKLKELNDRLSHLIFNNILQYSL